MNGKNQSKAAGSKSKKKETFSSKNIKHDPQAESARAKFGLRGQESGSAE